MEPYLRNMEHMKISIVLLVHAVFPFFASLRTIRLVIDNWTDVHGAQGDKVFQKVRKIQLNFFPHSYDLLI